MNSMGVRGTRNTRNSSSSNQSGSNPPPSPAKNNSSAPSAGAGEKRKQQDIDVTSNASPSKRMRVDDDASPRVVGGPPNVIEDTWFVCSDVLCSKRYRDISALKYHQNHAHKNLLLTREQDSEHNKTHVRFVQQQQQQLDQQQRRHHSSAAAQTDDKLRIKGGKKKKSKRNHRANLASDLELMLVQEQTAARNINSDHTGITAANNGNSGNLMKATDAHIVVSEKGTGSSSASSATTQSRLLQLKPSLAAVPGSSAAALATADGSGGLKPPQQQQQAFMQVTPLATSAAAAGATGGAMTMQKSKTVTAPIVPIPLASQAQADTVMSREEKKRERKKKKKEKREKKQLMLEQQMQQQQQSGSGQLAAYSNKNTTATAAAVTAANVMNNSGSSCAPQPLNVTSSSSSVVAAQTAEGAAGQSATQPHVMMVNKTLDSINNKSRNVDGDILSVLQTSDNTAVASGLTQPHAQTFNKRAERVKLPDSNVTSGSDVTHAHQQQQSSAYSDISDEGGNDHVPVLENQLEPQKTSSSGLASSASQAQLNNKTTACVGGLETMTKTFVKPSGTAGAAGQELPPSLTPVIMSSSSPHGNKLSAHAQSYHHGDGNKELMTTSTKTEAFRNVTTAAVSGSGVELTGSSREMYPGKDKVTSASEMQQKRSGVANSSVKPAATSQSVYTSYSSSSSVAGHVLNHNSAASAKSTEAMNRSTNHHERLASTMPHKAKDDMMKGIGGASSSSLLMPLSSASLHSGVATRLQDSRYAGDVTPRRSNDPTKGPPPPMLNGPPTATTLLSPSITETNKLNRSHHKLGHHAGSAATDGARTAAKAIEQRSPSASSSGASPSDRNLENERILKENLDIKMISGEAERDRFAAGGSPAAFYDARYAAYMQHQHRLAMQQQQYAMRGGKPPLEQTSGSSNKPMKCAPDVDSRLPSPAPPPSSSSQSTKLSHPATSSARSGTNSPMHSPKTKAELKQGRERTEAGKTPDSKAEPRRPASVERPTVDGGKGVLKSPAAPSMTAHVPPPPPGLVPPGYPYPFPMVSYGIPPYLFAGAPHPYMAAYPDSKALEMLQQQAAQYNREQNAKAQDLRKPPDKSGGAAPAPVQDSADSDRPRSRSEQAVDKQRGGESPGVPLMRAPPPTGIPPPLPGHPAAPPPMGMPPWYMSPHGKRRL